MKKILLCLGLIISTYAFVSAQANLFKNSHFEEQGAWLIVQQNPDSIVPYVFGSTDNTVLGGEGGNLEIKFVPEAPNSQIFIYQGVEVVADKEYLFNLAFRDLSAELSDCWWFAYFYSLLEPVDGTDIEEETFNRMNAWEFTTPGFNGTLDTALAAATDGNIVTFAETGTVYMGICVGVCATTGDFHFVMDEIEFIDPDAVSGINTQVADKGNTLSFYPNPASTDIDFTYSISRNSNVELSLINILGQEVATLINNSKLQGTYTESFDCSNLADGVYYGVLKVNNAIITKKIIVSK